MQHVFLSVDNNATETVGKVRIGWQGRGSGRKKPRSRFDSLPRSSVSRSCSNLSFFLIFYQKLAVKMGVISIDVG